MEIQHFLTEVLGVKSDGLCKTIASQSKMRFIRKGEILQNIGHSSEDLYFFRKGLLRGFFLDAEGQEITDCFAFVEGDPVIACFDLASPSVLCIEALEDSEVIAVPYRVILPMLNKDVELMKLYTHLLREALRMHWDNKLVLAQRNATERYQWFLERYEGLIDRVNHRHIASFLGMSPISLSRVRRALREKVLVREEGFGD